MINFKIMKKLAKFFLLAVVWLSFLWLSYAQDWTDRRSNPNADNFRWCQCLYSPEVYFLAISCIYKILLVSFLIFPLRNVFKKAWQKPRHSIIPLLNLYTLFDISKRKMFKKIFVWICFVILFFVIFGDKIQYYYFVRSNGCCTDLIWIDILLRTSLSIFILLLSLQLYHLARDFGWKKFKSILFVLFFPIWVRILSFGNYEYVWNKKDDNNLESK